MLSMPATADPTATKTSRNVPRNSAATERASVGDMPTSTTGRSRSPVLPSATAVRTGTRLIRPPPRRQTLRDAAWSARRRPAVEDVVDHRPRVAGDAAVVVQELAGVLIGPVAAGAGDADQLEARPGQLVARPAPHQEDRVPGPRGQLPRRAQRVEL